MVKGKSLALNKSLTSNPNVVLIVMDTARADHFSCYGYGRKTTPEIDKIAEKGTLFDNAFSAAEWSPSSHASIFTGKYPSHHRTMGRNIFLEKDNATIANILDVHGYETIGVSTNSIVSAKTGFGRGFQDYVELNRSTL